MSNQFGVSIDCLLLKKPRGGSRGFLRTENAKFKYLSVLIVQKNSLTVAVDLFGSDTKTTHRLDSKHLLVEMHLPQAMQGASEEFERIWSLHPTKFHEILIHGKSVKTPRWQQAYERDYQYTGSQNNALPIPELLRPYIDWAKREIDPRLNGLLLNWYDGGQQHYIGKHRDSTIGLVAGSPIVTISLGGTRAFRMRPWGGSGFTDFVAKNGAVFILPADTNQAWTHEVPASKRQTDRRISITLRAFE